MLKKLTPLHLEIIRRLVTGQRPSQVANDLPITADRIAQLQKEPIFAAELKEMEFVVKERLKDRLTALEQLEAAANSAVAVCIGAVEGRLPGDNEPVPQKDRINAAFDLLNRVGANRSKKTQTDSEESMADMIIEAYNKGRTEK